MSCTEYQVFSAEWEYTQGHCRPGSGQHTGASFPLWAQTPADLMGQIIRWESSLPIGMSMEKYELRLVSQQPWAHVSPSHTKGSHTLQEHWCGKTEKVGGWEQQWSGPTCGGDSCELPLRTGGLEP